jgi:hypothetical protein
MNAGHRSPHTCVAPQDQRNDSMSRVRDSARPTAIPHSATPPLIVFVIFARRGGEHEGDGVTGVVPVTLECSEDVSACRRTNRRVRADARVLGARLGPSRVRGSLFGATMSRREAIGTVTPVTIVSLARSTRSANCRRSPRALRIVARTSMSQGSGLLVGEPADSQESA